MATKVASMATTKRERQKAARRQKLEQAQRVNKRRKTIRRSVIVVVVAIVVVGSGALLFSGKGTPTTTTTLASTATTSTTTTIPVVIKPVVDPSPAGTFGKAPTMVIPKGAAPTTLESANLITGTGQIAETGDSLTVEYVLGTYSAGKVVQSSWTGSPFTFTLNSSSVIAGWADGVVGMRVGGRRELVIPASLGYGDESPGAGIAKNDTLVFIIDLQKVTTP
jgi:peptidylprolyl isomerase